MEAQLQEIREQQKASWNKFSPGWKKWDHEILDFMRPFADEIINSINPRGSDVILDVAAGTGEPGLSIAAMLSDGKVVITDLADDMLTIARENAFKKGITNVEFQACDVTELPFYDNTFDAVSCRMGFMFFPDMLLVTKEMFRVLKPGGRIAIAVWSGSEKNFWVTAIGGTINRNMQLVPPSPEAPGMFRCSKSGLMTDIFEQAGFKDVAEKELTGRLNCGTAEVYWDMMTEIAAPFVAALSNADEVMREKIKQEVFILINQKFPNENVIIDGNALVIAARK
ncbi:class I SAM-dependent methyltransferase [Flavobacterium ajazii]|uniref:class I SAM-dependent methyltransferase n=1 Tax=Flavobacterium ajazii TaxID=2692318 RepID=UPI0013D2DB77|nr:class I SAM-dependent methyltransferase [Flavobacterium ajazii]